MAPNLWHKAWIVWKRTRTWSKLRAVPFFCKGRTWHLSKFRTYCLCRAVFCPKFGLSIRFKRQNEAHTPIEKLPRSICVKLRGHIVKTEGRTFFVRWPDMLFLGFFSQFHVWSGLFHSIFVLSLWFKRQNKAHTLKIAVPSSNLVKQCENILKIEGRPLFVEWTDMSVSR